MRIQTICRGMVYVLMALCSCRDGHVGEEHTVVQVGSAEFGYLVGDFTGDHEFTYVNNLGVDLKLRSTSTECGCVTITSCSETVPLDGSLKLKIRINTAGQAEGSMTRKVYAVFVPGPVIFEGAVSATIAASPNLQPPIVEASVSIEGVFEATASLRLPSRWNAPSVVLQSASEALKVVIGDRIIGEVMENYMVHLSGVLPIDVQEAWYDATFRVSAAGKDAELLTLRLRVKRSSPWVVSPSVVFLPSGFEQKSSLFVRTKDGSEVENLQWGVEPKNSLVLQRGQENGEFVVLPGDVPLSTAKLRLYDEEYSVVIPVRTSRAREE